MFLTNLAQKQETIVYLVHFALWPWRSPWQSNESDPTRQNLNVLLRTIIDFKAAIVC